MLSLSSLLVLLSPLSAPPDAPALAREAGLSTPTAVELTAVPRESSSVAPKGRVDLRGTVEGLPLARSYARVWIGRDGSPLVVIGGDPVGPLAFSGPPAVDLQSALRRLEASGFTGSQGGTTGTLVVDPSPVRSRVVWRIDPPVDPVTLDNHVFFVDAHTGSVKIAFNRTRRAAVEVFPINPNETPVSEIVELDDVDETAEFLEGQYFRLLNCVLPAEDQPCSGYQPTLVADENGDFLYPVPDASIPARNIARGDAYAEVSAYYNLDRFRAFLATFGDPGLDCSQGESRASITVNRHTFANGEPEWFDNAFYTGACSGITSTIVMGQGAEYDFAWDGEIVIHEMGHGITARQAGEGTLGLPRRDQHSAGNDAGAINEGTSDYFGTVLSGDRHYADYTGEFSRDLDTDATCPAGLPGEIHDDGILWATALLDITDEVGLDFVPVVIDTLGMLELDTSFDAASATLEAITRDVMGDDEGDVVAEVMTARGLDECTRVAPIEDAKFGMWLLPNGWDVDYFPVRPPPFQVLFEVPENAVRVSVSFEPFSFGVPGMEQPWSVELLLKPDEPINFTYEEGAGQVVVDADSREQHSFEDDNTWTRDVVGGEILYGAFVNRGVAAMRMDDITVEYELAPDTGSSSSSSEGGTVGPGSDTSTGPEDPSTSTSVDPVTSTTTPPVGSESSDTDDTSAADETSDGCGCQALDPSPGLAWLLLGVLGLGFRPRRPRGRSAQGPR